MYEDYYLVAKTRLDAAKSLDHPCIVKVTGWSFGNPESDAIIEMEVVKDLSVQTSFHSQGEETVSVNLLQLLKCRTMIPQIRKCLIVVEMMMGLSYLHSHGFVHGDLQPSNILLDEDWHVKICDYLSIRGLSMTHNSLGV